VEPQHAAQVRELRVQPPAEACLERALDATREAELGEPDAQCRVQLTIGRIRDGAGSIDARGQREAQGEEEVTTHDSHTTPGCDCAYMPSGLSRHTQTCRPYASNSSSNC